MYTIVTMPLASLFSSRAREAVYIYIYIYVKQTTLVTGISLKTSKAECKHPWTAVLTVKGFIGMVLLTKLDHFGLHRYGIANKIGN